MKKGLTMVVLMIIGLFVAAPVYGEDLFRVKVKYWNSEIDGNVTADTKLVSGTKLDLVKDLDLDKTMFIPELEFRFKFGMNKLIGSYAKTTYTGEETLTSDVNFGGTTYSVNSLVKTNLDLTLGSVLYERVFVPEFITKAFPSVAEAEAGVLLGVKYLSADAKLTSPVVSKTESGSVPIPVIGLFLQMGVLDKKLNFEIGMVGLKTTISGVTAKYTDFYIDADFNFIKAIPIGLGYKINRFSIEDKSSNTFGVNLNLSGPYIFTRIEF